MACIFVKHFATCTAADWTTDKHRFRSAWLAGSGVGVGVAVAAVSGVYQMGSVAPRRPWHGP